MNRINLWTNNSFKLPHEQTNKKRNPNLRANENNPNKKKISRWGALKESQLLQQNNIRLHVGWFQIAKETLICSHHYVKNLTASSNKHISRTLKRTPFQKHIRGESHTKGELLPAYVQWTVTTNFEVTSTPRAQGRTAARDPNEFSNLDKKIMGRNTSNKRTEELAEIDYFPCLKSIFSAHFYYSA